MMNNIREKLVGLLTGGGICFRCLPSVIQEEEAKQRLADHLIVNGVTVQEWIPVTERLPQDMQERVLVTTDCDTPVGNQKIDTDRFRSGEWVRYGSHVTHWMPLPTPPKGECPDYRECNKTHDLRRYRPKCSKAKEQKVFTNAERFRKMSDEEQQSWVRGFWEIEDFAYWLKQPWKEE